MSNTLLGNDLQKELANVETIERWQAFEQHDESVSHERVTEWLNSWGGDDELSCPCIIKKAWYE